MKNKPTENKPQNGEVVRSKVTPPKLAHRWGISPEKVLAWIQSGELRAIDASTKRGGRPRYLIDEADIADFENRRAAGNQPRQGRGRARRNETVIEFF